MNNLPDVSQDELILRAETLYFEKNVMLKEIFANTKGHFFYTAESAQKATPKNIDVIRILRDAINKDSLPKEPKKK